MCYLFVKVAHVPAQLHANPAFCAKKNVPSYRDASLKDLGTRIPELATLTVKSEASNLTFVIR